MQVESMMGQFRNLVKQMSDDELHEAGIYLTQQLTKKEDFVEVNIFSIRIKDLKRLACWVYKRVILNLCL